MDEESRRKDEMAEVKRRGEAIQFKCCSRGREGKVPYLVK